MKTEKKLTIDQLKNYLGTGLKLYMDYDDESYVDVLTGIIDDYYFTKEGEGDDYHIRGIRPFMYRLSDLDKFIPELGFVPWEELGNRPNLRDYKVTEINFMKLPFDLLTQLFQWHFWVFDQSYFDEGLIIDKLNKS